jgi:hypothetical protein
MLNLHIRIARKEAAPLKRVKAEDLHCPKRSNAGKKGMSRCPAFPEKEAAPEKRVKAGNTDMNQRKEGSGNPDWPGAGGQANRQPLDKT